MAWAGVEARVSNGVHTVEDIEGNVISYKKWRVENSWGTDDAENAPDSGFYRMFDSYFDKYVTMAAVDLKYFEPDEARQILENASACKSFVYKYTDAFGCVAKCNRCK
jgi:aminopeptidase C